jgi:hypothetical protein
MNMPVEELEVRSQAFHDALIAIEEQRRTTRDLLAGNHRRLREALDSSVVDLRRKIATNISRTIDVSLTESSTAWEETARRTLSQALQNEFEAERPPLVNAIAADAGAALHICEDRINGLIDRVRQTAAELFDIRVRANIEHEPFELGEDPYWVTESVSVTLVPDPSRLLDRLLPASRRRSRLRARMIREAEELVIRSAENLRWAIWRGLDDTFRKATSQFEERLDEAIATTRDVIKDALARRKDRSFTVRPELDRLAAAAASLASFRKELQGD